jgi:hypothetical protein
MNTNLSPDEIERLAGEVGQMVSALQNALPLEDDLSARDRRTASARKGVPTSAIEAAVAILDEIGERVGSFDVEGARRALALESALGNVADKLRFLAGRLDATLAKRRSIAAATTSGLYQSLKGHALTDGALVPHAWRLQAEVRRSRRSKKESASAPAGAGGQPVTVTNGGQLTAHSVTITPAGVTVGAAKP